MALLRLMCVAPLAAVVTLAPGAPALAQSLPPCPPKASKLRVSVTDENSIPRRPRATHVVRVVPNRDDLPSEGNVTWTGPPGLEQEYSTASFTVDQPGPVVLVGRWQSSYETGPELDVVDCEATKELTLDVIPAPPPGFFPPAEDDFGGQLPWNLRFNPATNLRPLVLRVRGVEKARRPGRGARSRVVSIAMREGDSGTDLRRPRWFKLGGWLWGLVRAGDRIQLKARPGGWFPKIPAGLRFGFEVTWSQGGELIGRTTAVGRCGNDACFPRVRTRRG
jgi:hypothetical protein